MGHYKSNVRDLEFNLFEVLGVQERLGKGVLAESDEETARGVLSELNKLATGPLAESFADADRNPPVYDPKTFSVKIPESFKKSYKQLLDGEWWRLGLTNDLGGFGLPPTVQWAASELILGANAPLFMYLAGPNFAMIVNKNGTEEQKHWAQLMIDRAWGATMVLTEPDAGSDVGAGRTKATKQEDGSWHIDGVKRFITSAEHDMSENIMHLVLARPEGPGIETKPGTKGLSLFLVPKFHFDSKTGELGERNGAYVTNVEHKMGIKASTTCELTFGQHGTPAKGWLLGEVHDGIAQMFQVIEYARMMVGTKAIATLSTGYLNALEYAKERVQGADLPNMLNKAAPRVTITHHPDVRRSLMLQKAYAEGLRAVYLYTASFQDQLWTGEGDQKLAHGVNDLLLPIVKGVGSERATEQLVQSLQTLGGSGFLQDYPIEQYIRDAKIDSLYEGTTAIQSLDFFFRKIVRDKGQSLAFVAGEITKFIESEAGNGRLKNERGLLKQALEDTQGMLGSLIGYLTASQEDPQSINKVGQHTVRLLMSVGDLLIGWQLLKHAEVAIGKLDAGASAKDVPFYEGKIAVASFFAKQVLPELTARRAIVEAADNALMELDEAAF
ncbi:acyl-CoA dehydrogenase [Amycolatopsis mediterranei S699]|uniref:Broad-specificity linear acyl-CoA dehydrogenase FadE5 n=2 Tax=Amycolatopsis mediterranei TaxID=33910 RepID=A0A0H3DJ69_AMYMU|nr:acyl-CoA dehydrogenase [Amycolatopsis mediterranei]ADJ50885.1 acyl-CoA dehydrogenase [Amycolatopsis mediterranei U32]AEK47898.1 acyl-CoA dehydrogenase [Amycolatopsis mediterranei S699]AFO82591.1 acyl-CoA dehydrogenase [Amycolatopsis mediterranei S699]AGT89720.1 acyl-CoA dehydrogenase [Amycolatopsis mediterranei RB]KDO12121.1 butyryl-CoA dehydrogenase [Amycolatopsis mediterranei]